MIVVTIEKWPGGDPARAERVGQVQISNVEHLGEVSDYHVEFYGSKGELREHRNLYRFSWRDGAWALVQRIFAGGKMRP